MYLILLKNKDVLTFCICLRLNVSHTDSLLLDGRTHLKGAHFPCLHQSTFKKAPHPLIFMTYFSVILPVLQILFCVRRSELLLQRIV